MKTTDGARLSLAVHACLDRLKTDLRVEAYYQTWIASRDLDRLVRRVLAWQDSPDVDRHAAALRAALFGPPSPDERAQLGHVLETMGVPWPWVTEPLFMTFPRDYVNASRRPSDDWPPLTIAGAAEMVPTATTDGRLPPELGARIRRHVDWWYRWKIKHPKDELQELEAEELARTGQTTVSRRHSTVIQGVQQVEQLLSVWKNP